MKKLLKLICITLMIAGICLSFANFTSMNLKGELGIIYIPIPENPDSFWIYHPGMNEYVCRYDIEWNC